jgi:hypothetical protein
MLAEHLERSGLLELPEVMQIDHYSYIALRPAGRLGPMHPERVTAYRAQFENVRSRPTQSRDTDGRHRSNSHLAASPHPPDRRLSAWGTVATDAIGRPTGRLPTLARCSNRALLPYHQLRRKRLLRYQRSVCRTRTVSSVHEVDRRRKAWKEGGYSGCAESENALYINNL